MTRCCDSTNMRTYKNWEEEVAQKLLMRRLALQKIKDGGWVHHGHYSQRAIAKKLGVTAACLHNWEYGKTTPHSWTVWERWANTLYTKFEIILVDLPSSEDRKEKLAELIQRSFK